MKELLDLERRELTSAEWFIDEGTGRSVQISEEVSEVMFGRFMELHSMIQQDQENVKIRCLFIGMALDEIERDKLYNYVCVKGQYVAYSSFYKFCKEIFGFSKITVQRMLGVVRDFCGVDGTLKIEYVNYSFRQLVEMRTIDVKYHNRIPVTMSTRNIHALGELYQEYVPSQDSTAEDDLKEWSRRKAEKNLRENAKNNEIQFVAATGSARSPSENESDGSDFSDPDEFDGEDERDIITPQEEKIIPFSAIEKGLHMQLSLLKKHHPEWSSFIVAIGMALVKRNPNALFYNDSGREVDSRYGKDLYRNEERLKLKNKKEREEWLTNFRKWGVWIDVPEVSKRFYRYDFCNGYAMIVEEYYVHWDYAPGQDHVSLRYGVIDDKHERYEEGAIGGFSGAVEWLTKNAKEI